MLSTKVVLEDNTLITTDLAGQILYLGQIFIAARQRWQRGHRGKEKSDKDEGGGIKETQRDIEETHRRDMSGNDEGEDTEERQER